MVNFKDYGVSLLISFSLAFICDTLYNVFKLKYSLPKKDACKRKLLSFQIRLDDYFMFAVYLVMLSFLIYGVIVSAAHTERLIWGFLGLFVMSIFVGVIGIDIIGD